MRKILALILVLMLLLPAVASATEAPDEGEPQGPQGYTISLFGYAIVVVPATEEDPAVVGVFKADENGEPTEEEVTSFTLGGILGSSVSALAKAVTPGPGHGKVVSAFVKTVNEERKKAKQAQIEQRKEQKQKEIRERKEEREHLKLQKREEKQEKKEEHQQEVEAKKEKAKDKEKPN